ncbi:hypothetical protein GC163_04985 [bacterium]|nr:hypothetical protein [bacterium]
MNIVKDLLPLLDHLVPGLIAAWLYYSLTAHPKLDAFERVIEALIFTTLVRVLIPSVEFLLINLGTIRAIGTWTSEVQLGWSLVLGVILGIAGAAFTNNDLPHRWLRDPEKWIIVRRFPRLAGLLSQVTITRQTNYPSEWYGAFQRSPQPHWALMQLRSDENKKQSAEVGLRLYALVEEWPNSQSSGHFVLNFPSWQKDDGTLVDCPHVLRMLIKADQVQWLQIMVPPGFEMKNIVPEKKAT